MMRITGTIALAGALLLCGCEGEQDERLRNSAQADVEEAVEDVEQRADKVGEEVKQLGKDLKREATRAADEVDFGNERAGPAREK